MRPILAFKGLVLLPLTATTAFQSLKIRSTINVGIESISFTSIAHWLQPQQQQRQACCIVLAGGGEAGVGGGPSRGRGGGRGDGGYNRGNRGGDGSRGRGGRGGGSSGDSGKDFLDADFDLEELLNDAVQGEDSNWKPRNERGPRHARAPRDFDDPVGPSGGGRVMDRRGGERGSDRGGGRRDDRGAERGEGGRDRSKGGGPPGRREQQAPPREGGNVYLDDNEEQGEGGAEGLGHFDEFDLPPIEYREENFAAAAAGGGYERGVARLADDYFFSKKDFDAIGASEEAQAALESLGINRPSKIQTIAYPHVLEGTSCIIAEQTGSGKTVAYLLPLLQRIRQLEVDSLGRAVPKSPRLVILTPTGELAAQVAQVARSLTKHIKLRVSCVTGGKSARTQRDMLNQGVDVIIGTPGRVQYLLEDKMLNLSDMKALVLDEVDVMFLDDTFDLSVIGAAAPLDTQFLFVTATLPVAVADQISKEFPGVKKLWGPGLHKIAPQVEEVLVDCSGPEDEEKNEETAFLRKRDMLVQNLLKLPVPRTLIFCNSIPTCRKVENALGRADRRGRQWKVLAYHSAVNPQDRDRNLEIFSRTNAPIPYIMICTDRTSRGVDFDTADVEHVVLFDFPRDPSEYVRRVGRTGRAGRVGRVTALVLGKQVSLARNIMEGNAKGDRVHPVPN